MKRLLILLMLIPAASMAQNRYYFGLDVGPKYDRYVLATGGARPYSPSIELKQDIGAIFGISGGVVIEDKLMLEAGLFRSNFRAVFNLVNEDGQKYFTNTPVNTFTSYMIPVNLLIRKPIRSKEGMYIHYGGGFSSLVGSKLGLTEGYVSHAEPVDPSDMSKGNIAYTITQNDFDAKIIALNLTFNLHYPVNEFLAGSISLSGKLGVAGNNFVDITHTTPDYSEIKNSFFTTGSGIQLQLGFRYFLDGE